MKQRALRGSHRDNRGAAAVEFALVVIPLVTIVLGVLGYGFMLSFRQSVSQAAAEGARAAAVAPSTADREAIAFSAIESSFGGLTCADDTDFLQCSIDESTCDTCISVTVDYDYTDDPTKPVFLGLGLVMPDTLTYTATAQTN